jgi:AraC-like DNA-binding protein
MHGHRFFVLNYYDRGVGRICFPRGGLDVEAGHVVLAVPGELHDTTGIGHMGGWVVEFTGDIFGSTSVGPSLMRAHAGGAPWLAFTERPFGHAHAVVPAQDQISWERRLVRLQSEVLDAAIGAQGAIRALMHLLLIDFSRLLVPASLPERSSKAPLVSEVLAVIELRLAEPGLSLTAIARAVGRSRSHVTQVLRAETGMTVLQWLTERRMAEARRRLQETDEDVAIVGERVGYLDPTYFARRFQHAHGMSARAYRRALR